jgi:hypothetical protein
VQTFPASWLVEPLALDVIEAKLGRHVNHPNWQRLKRLARPGDEFWRFRSPPHTGPNKLGAAGYALVRAGVPVSCFTNLRS